MPLTLAVIRGEFSLGEIPLNLIEQTLVNWIRMADIAMPEGASFDFLATGQGLCGRSWR